jgi:Mce-associated membrane protein
MEKTTPGAVLEADADHTTDADDATDAVDSTASRRTDAVDATEETSGAAADGPTGTGKADAAEQRAAAPAGPGRKRWLLRGGLAAGSVLLVVATVLAVVFAWKLHDRDRVDAAARDAAATAQSYAVTLTSIDSQHIDQNFTDVLNGATGDFKDMYSQSSTQLKALLVQNKAVSKGRVVDASIKSASADRVEVMLFVDQEVSNSASPDPRIDRSRILMTMQRVGGHWLAAKVEMV